MSGVLLHEQMFSPFPTVADDRMGWPNGVVVAATNWQELMHSLLSSRFGGVRRPETGLTGKITLFPLAVNRYH